MSCKLWQYFLLDDVENFKRFLANASYAANSQKPGGNATTGPSKFGSPGSGLGSFTNNPFKNFKPTSASPGSSVPEKTFYSQPGGGSTLTRFDVNSRDRYGRTLLHLAASSQDESAYDFALALLAIPFLDIYTQDLESGWTALHRALYAGNVAIARALMARDAKDATDFSTPGGGHHPSGGLIKIKDREGNSPFDVFGATVASRSMSKQPIREPTWTYDSLSDSSSDGDVGSLHDDPSMVQMQENLMGDEVFTFGSNKNLSLGLGDEDDRQFPERVVLKRPDHLLHRLGHERGTMREARKGSAAVIRHQEFESVADLPILVRGKPVACQDIIMSKLHTGIMTDDPESNLFMCGFGPGGRLGTGDEATRFSFTCIETGGLSGKKVVALALGQDHSIAVSQQGEVFTWGSNKYGQLGYTLPRSNQKKDIPVQSTPRQIFNPFKKDTIIGAAASPIHSVVFTSMGLYTFGKNEGQLGLIDADARSLEFQVIPRRVGASLFSSHIAMVAAIDRATTCLLENHDVWVFTHYGYSKLVFPLDNSSAFLKSSFLTTRYGNTINYISKITAGGNAICAMSSFGEVYSISVTKKADTSSTAASTTNPAKIRNSLPQPSRVWSIKKSHMAVRDVDVGQDGSIIICTESGSAWRKEKRAKAKTTSNSEDQRQKDYKFVRIPGLSRVVAVRSNAFGAYAAVQRGCEVTKEQITVAKRALWDNIWPLVPFKELLVRKRETDISVKPDYIFDPADVGKPDDMDSDIPVTLEASLRENIRRKASTGVFQGSVWVSSTLSDVRIPVHEFMVAARSPLLRRALKQFRESYYYSISDFLAIEYDKDGQTQIQFQGVTVLSLFNIVLFIYTDQLYDIWMKLWDSSHNAHFYRQIRVELVKLASQLEIKDLEEATRIMFQPRLTLNLDMERAMQDPCYFDSADAIIELDETEVKAHSQILCQRCPFFEGLFYGRAAGRWVAARQESADFGDATRIDLKHIDHKAFAFVLRHIYADTDEELFEDVHTDDLEDFIDLIIGVMAVANELMLDRLAQICQKLLGHFVNTRNVCHLLNAVAPCIVTSFKEAAFEFICLNLEVMLENRLLDDLDPDLLHELDEVCRLNQLAHLPISRGRNTLSFAIERYPEIVPQLEQDKQRRVDSMRLGSRLHEDEIREEKFRVGSVDKTSLLSPIAQKDRPINHSSNIAKSVPGSPLIKSKQSTGDLIFQMDDDSVLSPPGPKEARTPLLRPDSDIPSQSRHLSTPATPKAKATDDGAGILGDPTPSPASFDLQQPLSKGKQLVTSPPTPEERSSSKAHAPWGSMEPPSTRADLSGIMAEAPAPKPASRREGGGGNFAATKLSQKERKKLKQQQMQEELADTQPEPSKAESTSPWGPVPAVPNDRSNRTASQPRTPSRAALTLRQTVAGTPPLGPQDSTPDQKPVSKPTVQSTPPRPSPQQHPHRSEYASQSQTPIYVPTPAESSHFGSSTQRSLASILQEQQTEKDSIREAATAKHNLHDIQLEQEFQEWWNKESQRVQEEAQAADTKGGRSARSTQTATSRGRGGRGGRGSGKGKERVSSAGQNQHQHQHQQGHRGHKPGESNHDTGTSAMDLPSSATGDASRSQHSALTGEKRSAPERGRRPGNHPPPSGRGRGAGGRGRGTDKPHHHHHHQQPHG